MNTELVRHADRVHEMHHLRLAFDRLGERELDVVVVVVLIGRCRSFHLDVVRVKFYHGGE